MNELDAARLIATGALPSPTPIGGFQLWAIRLTGTGRAERTALAETVYRDPNTWLSAETLARCAGMAVLVEHPPGPLTSAEYASRNVGAVLYPYIADSAGIQNDTDPNNLGPEVWAIIRCYDDATNMMLQERTLSTSPAVTFKSSDGNVTVPMASGHILLEGTPSLLDHVSLVPIGVWDRDGGPSGIRNDLITTRKDAAMADVDEREGETEMEGAETSLPKELGAQLDKFLSVLDNFGKRLDAMEGGDKKRDAERSERDPDVRDPGDLSKRPPPEDRRTVEERHRGLPAGSGDFKDHVARQTAERADAAAKSLTQSRADAVYMDMGSRAPASMQGESLQSYRTRLARGLQRHSAGFAAIDLATVGGAAFDAIEDRIYADAADAARKGPEHIPGMLRELVKVDAAGRRISTFHGDETFIHQMSGPSRRVVAFNTDRRTP